MDIGKASTGIPINGGRTQSDQASIDDAARKLEGAFAKLLISSMRSTALGDSMFPGSAEHFRDMYDEKIAETLTRGKGLGLQPMIRRELGGRESAFDAAQRQIEQASRMYPIDGYRPLPAAMRSLPLPAAVLGAPPAPSRAIPTVAPPQAHLQAPPSARLSAQPTQSNSAAERVALATARHAARTVASDDCDGSPVARPKPNTPEAFVAEIWPHAQRAAAELGVCPRALVAQAALETGWGRHTIRGGNGHDAPNLFGIKTGSRWQGESVKRNTTEYVDGTPQRENAAFRAYRSIADSFADYVSLLKNSPRYAAALGQSSARAFAGALQRAGYATDPQYAAKLSAIVEGPTLRRALAQVDATSAQRS
jgi:peptidoglycan hydrolase FlgJ